MGKHHVTESHQYGRRRQISCNTCKPLARTINKNTTFTMTRIRKEWDTPKKARAKMLLDFGYCTRGAAREMQNLFGKSPSHVQIARWRTHLTDRRTGRNRSGQKPIINDAKMEEMIATITGRYRERIKDIELLAQEHGIQASQRTLQRAWARHGYHRHGYHRHIPDMKPYLSPKNKA